MVIVMTSVAESVLSNTVSVNSSSVGSGGAVNVVCADLELSMATVGVSEVIEVCSHSYLRSASLPSGSVPEPFSVTVLPGGNVLSRPAFAVGGWFGGAVTVMVTASRVPAPKRSDVL